MKFVHIADLHLGRRFKTASFAEGFGRIKREAIGKNLDQVIRYCNKESVDLLIMAGDILDGEEIIDVADMYNLVYRLKKLNRTQVAIIAGNHDPLSQTNSVYSWVTMPKHVKILGTEPELVVYEDLDLSIIGGSWKNNGPMTCPQQEYESLINEAETKYKILLSHGDIYTENEYQYLSPDWLKTLPVDYVALGHIHKRDVIEHKIVYPGSLEPLDFKETGDHGFMVGELSEQRLDLAFIPSMVHKMEIIELDITGLESMLELTDVLGEQLEQAVEGSMIRIRLFGEKHRVFDDLSEQVRLTLQDQFIYPKGPIAYIEIKDKTVPSYDIETLRQEHKDDLIGLFIEALDTSEELDQKALKEGLSILLGVGRT